MKKKNFKKILYTVIALIIVIVSVVLKERLVTIDDESNENEFLQSVKKDTKMDGKLYLHFIDQTCSIMIQRLRTIFQRNPLISMGI